MFADPKKDLVFKRIFGDESHKDLLIALLNPLLQLDEPHRIVDLTYLPVEQAPRIRELKNSIVDVKCIDAQGTRYVVEMQVLNVEGFEKRIVYNLCKAFTAQLTAGDDYPVLNDVVAVTICAFVLWPSREPPHIPMLSRWSMREEETGARRLQQMRYAFLELPKYGAGDDPRTMVDKWAYFFRATAHLKNVPPALSEAPFARALDVARSSGFTSEEWEAYDRAKIAEQDARGALSLERRLGMEEGIEQGIERGIEQGIERGIEQGRAAGRKEGLIMAIEDLCIVLGVELTADRRGVLASLDEAGLRAVKSRLLEQRRWE